ncbi:hypothetical protein OS493_009382 [Desmophyllum pertusum]|uniref:Uncharacterized protein n=1 Tax=Desmophyllum pertusum TaxID=174260 RepID=A0A9X0CS54_9CNID|nr:hypothetical protein OS493_009382 [Desmophyllum pertusum]
MSCYGVMSVSSGLTLYKINKNRLTFPGSTAASMVACVAGRRTRSARSRSTPTPLPPLSTPATQATSTEVACSSQTCEDENQLLIPESANIQNPDDPGDIPREIPLNEEQEDRFWKKIWAVFVNGCRGAKHLVTNLSHAVLRFLSE